MPRRLPIALAVAAVALLLAGVPALGASAGQSFLIGGLDLPPGAVPGGETGAAGGGADRSSISRDGRYVAFVAQADTLAAAANPDAVNVYRKDRLTGAVVLVSRATGAAGATSSASSTGPVISDDGSRVAFKTTAALDPSDTDGGTADVYVRDVGAATTTLASVGNGGAQTTTTTGDFDLSGDGQHVAFQTADALDAADDRNTGAADVYVRDLTGRATTLASSPNNSPAAGNAASYTPAISDDGRWVAFVSDATNLVGGYVAGRDGMGNDVGRQLFARDMATRATALVSADETSSTKGGNGQAGDPDIAGAPTGTLSTVKIAYDSRATNLDGGADDGATDSSVYVRTLSSTPSVLVSRADGGSGASADSRAELPSISEGGDVVVFQSDATNLGAGADYYGVYVRDVGASRTLLASTANDYAVQGAISGNGSFLTWYNARGVTADSDPDLGGVFGRTYAAPSTLGAAEFVSRPAGSAPFLAPAFEVGDPDPGARTISSDGRYVVLLADSSRLPGATPPYEQVYRRDTLTGAIELVSRANGPNGAPASGYVAEPTISADGTRVAFTAAAANLEDGSTSRSLVYVRDLVAGTTTLASRADGTGGAAADASANDASIAPDGKHVTFVSSADNLGAPAGRRHLFLRDLAGGRTVVVDRANGLLGAIGNGDVEHASPSADGRLVAFASASTNLDPDDPDSASDIYVRDTVAGTTTLASRQSGAAGAHAARASYEPALSADGRVVAFETFDERLATEGGPWGLVVPQVVARNLSTHQNTLVSGVAGGLVANRSASDPSVSGDGSLVAFDSLASNLVPGLGGGVRGAVFVRTMATGALEGPPAFGLLDTAPQDHAIYPSVSEDGQCVTFIARGHNAVTGTAGDFYTAYVYVVSGECPKPLPVSIAARSGARRPTIAKLSLSHKRFRVGRRRTPKVAGAAAAVAPRAAAGAHHGAAKRKAAQRSAAHRKAGKRRARHRRHRRAPVGTTFRFTLNARANVSIAIERQAPGRLVGRFCRRPSHRLRRHLRCVRFARVGRITRRGMPAGRERIAFSGRIGRRALKPGRYRARVRASNSAGTSAWRRAAFTVVRR